MGRPPPKELADPPPLPPGGKRLWGWFLDLHAHRRRTDWGDPVPLDHAALLAWRTLMAVPIAPADAALLLELDRLWRRVDAETAPTPPGKPAAADEDDDEF